MPFWIFQGNPTRYDVDVYLRDHRYIYWAIDQHKKEIGLSDVVFIWRANSNRNRRGVIAMGYVVEAPRAFSSIKFPEHRGDEYWSSQQPPDDYIVAGIQIIGEQPIQEYGILSVPYLKADSVLREMQILQKGGARGKTNLKLTDEQGKRLSDLWGLPSKILFDESAEDYPEGAIRYAEHRMRERSANLVRQAKSRFKHQHGRLFCELCRFDFADVYGAVGEDFIEAHHIKHVAQMRVGEKTKVEDLMMLCANCHRMAHRLKPESAIDEIRTQLKR